MIVNKVRNRLLREKKKWSSALSSHFNNPYLLNVPLVESIALGLEMDYLELKENRFDVFGIETLDVEHISARLWGMDHRTGHRWPTRWHSLLSYKLGGESDVKVPWELGRGHNFSQLALNLVNDEQGFDKLQQQISLFNKINPVGYGVQWQCSMDVAIRLVNLLHAVSMTSSSRLTLASKTQSIFGEHYSYICSNPEVFDNGFRNNHYLADLMGRLYYISIVGDDEVQLDKLFSELLSEVESQFLADGGNFEGSTSYHFLSLEIVVLSISIYAHAQAKLGREFGLSNLNNIEHKLRKAIEFAHFCCSQSGYICRVGDDDSGFVIRPYRFNEIPVTERNRYLTKLRLAAFDTCLTELQQGWQSNSYNKVFMTLFGLQTKSENLQRNQTTEQHFKQFGLYKLEKNGFEVFFRHIDKLGCRGKGGHNHADDGSFELYINGYPFIADPGTYCYTANPKKRNAYRSSACHNVTSVVNEEQFIFSLDDKMLFAMQEKPETSSSVTVQPDSILHRSNRNGSEVIRTISICNDGLKIKDKLAQGSGVFNLTLHPDVCCTLKGDTVVFSALGIVAEVVGGNSIQIEQAHYSYYYLNESGTKAIKIQFSESVTIKFRRELL